ncbi:MAG TPA: lysophospholipid acyltransferase family protein, partial [Gemmatimonadales bacterium]|nr:lysophospholipid acyltransferase family protein [Gemmatimonadales bacterium]
MLRRLVDTLASIWTWTALVTLVALAFPLILVWRLVGWPVDPWNYAGGLLFRRIAWVVQAVTPRWRFETRGKFPADPRLPYVAVGNHESFADIILISTLPWEMKWLSKASLMMIPVFGWTMWAVRDVRVHRGRATSARDAMKGCAARLRGKVSVMIFPEGTRSRSEEMLPFKDGAFRLAIEAGVPILPLAVYGTRQAIAKHDWRIGKTHAVVEVLATEPTAG